MKYVSDSATIVRRYDIDIDIDIERARRPVRRVSTDPLLQKLVDCLVLGREEELLALVAQALETKTPMQILSEALVPGMREVSRLWDEGGLQIVGSA